MFSTICLIYKTDILFCHKFSIGAYLNLFISSEYFNCYKIEKLKMMDNLTLSELSKGMYMTGF